MDTDVSVGMIGYAWWLSGLVLQLLLNFWPVTLALLVAAYLSISRRGLPEDQQLRSLPSVLFLFPVLMILWGAIAHLEPGAESPIPWRIAVLAVIVVLHLAMTGAVVFVSRGYRQQTAWLAMLISWIALACIVQTSLALTGRLTTPL